MSRPGPRPIVNAAAVELTAGPANAPGFETRSRQLGPPLGGQLLGGSVYELDPGERTGPYHYEVGNEECVLVLAGTPTLRHPEGQDVLDVGDMVVFPDGPAGAHQLINESTTVTRVLVVSSTREPCERAYPDSGTLSTRSGVFRIADAIEDGNGESTG